MKVGSLSASKLNTFFTCELQYYAKYELGIKDPPGEPAKFGSAFHKIMETIVNTKKCPDIVAVAKEFDVITRTDDLVKLTKSTLQNGYLSNAKNIKAVEIGFDLPIKNRPTTNVRGFIDRLDLELDKNYATVIDIKTGSHPFTKKELVDNIQAKVYALATKRLYPEITKLDMIFWFVKSQKRQLVEFDKYKIDAFEDELTNIADKIDKIVTPCPTENKYCKYCVYFSQCPVFNRKPVVTRQDGSTLEIVPTFKKQPSASDVALDGI